MNDFNRRLHAVMSGHTDFIPHPDHPRLFEDDYGMSERSWEPLPWIESVHCDGYAEPGYDQPKSGVIVLANWNNDKEKIIRASFANPKQTRKPPDELLTIGDALDLMDVDGHFSDEWTDCSLCNKLVRTCNNGPGWKRFFIQGEDASCVCGLCVRRNPSELEHMLGRHDAEAILAIEDVPLKKLKLQRLSQDFELGMHGGQNARPALIAAALRKRKVTRFLFVLDSCNPFETLFSVHVDRKQAKRCGVTELPWDEVNGSDIAENIKRALQSPPNVIPPVHPGGVNYTRIDGDTGEHYTKIVPQKDLPRVVRE